MIYDSLNVPNLMLHQSITSKVNIQQSPVVYPISTDIMKYRHIMAHTYMYIYICVYYIYIYNIYIYMYAEMYMYIYIYTYIYIHRHMHTYTYTYNNISHVHAFSHWFSQELWHSGHQVTGEIQVVNLKSFVPDLGRFLVRPLLWSELQRVENDCWL